MERRNAWMVRMGSAHRIACRMAALAGESGRRAALVAAHHHMVEPMAMTLVACDSARHVDILVALPARRAGEFHIGIGVAVVALAGFRLAHDIESHFPAGQEL